MKFFNRIKSEEGSPIWIMIYSDLITNLTLFFLMLFIVERMPKEIRDRIYSGKAAVQEVRQKIEEMKQAVFDSSLLEIEGRDAEISREARGMLRIRLKSPVLFGVGDSELTSEAKETLFNIGKVLKLSRGKIIVEGHTDNTPVYGRKYIDNLELSVKRAISVVNYFSLTLKMREERFIAAGYGEYRPIDTGSTAAARARNRRIEILLMPE